MDDVTENSIRQDQAESFGRLMAGFSHDMKNHLGVIRESNGLMSDLINMVDFNENERLAERLKKSIDSIERRVKTTAEMFHYLSSFAHRSDTPHSFVHINDLITEECIFLERFSRLRKINLTLELGQGLASKKLEASLLQHVFYRIYMIALEQLSTGDNLVISTSQQDHRTNISFKLSGKVQKIPEDLISRNLQAALRKLDGNIEVVILSEERAAIHLSLQDCRTLEAGTDTL